VDDSSAAIIHRLLDRIDALECELRRVRAPMPAVPQGPQLSERELQVGRLLLQGHTRKEIAVMIGAKANTVKAHTTAIYRKLDIHDMHGLRGKRELFEQP
jgi:DNA-binding NarL/FixJ family response regulator